RFPPRLCENAQEPTTRRIVFSIALFPIAATALFLIRLTKSRRTFYAQIECLCFHTASVEPARSGATAGRSEIDPVADRQDRGSTAAHFSGRPARRRPVT